ncbi:MAG: protoporphyrinogen oxidase [Terracidiphilus sp.]
MRTAVIGGGIAGLAAAYELEQARTAGQNLSYTLFESRPQLGGCISSQIVEGAVIERGPDSFLSEKPAAAELCRELGLGADLTPSNDAGRSTYIVVRNRLVSLPEGLMFLVPTKLVPTALSPLFSLRTKARMALELLHPPRPSEGDETVAALVERHFGRETVDRLADPLLSGIYGGDARQLSARAVLPRLVEMESRYGSLTRGMLAAHAALRARAKAFSSGNGGAPASRAIFTTLRGGLQQMVDALVARLDPSSVRLSAPVGGIEKTAEGWRIQAGAGPAELYDAVILAVPAWAAGLLLAPVDATLAEDLSAIPYSSSITINLVYDESCLGPLPAGFGFLVPAVEGRAMLACTFVHRKFLGRTPPGKAVLRAFLGGMHHEALLNAPDEVLVATLRRELTEILGERVLPASAVPEHVAVARWRRSMAQYAIGHLERRERIARRVAALESLRLAGNAYDGIGISDCIRLGRRAAAELLAGG